MYIIHIYTHTYTQTYTHILYIHTNIHTYIFTQYETFYLLIANTRKFVCYQFAFIQIYYACSK